MTSECHSSRVERVHSSRVECELDQAMSLATHTT